MAEVAVSRIMFRDILMLIAQASSAARTSVRGAGIECDKQRRQGAVGIARRPHEVALVVGERVELEAGGGAP
jgi:hypothetical protein